MTLWHGAPDVLIRPCLWSCKPVSTQYVSEWILCPMRNSCSAKVLKSHRTTCFPTSRPAWQ